MLNESKMVLNEKPKDADQRQLKEKIEHERSVDVAANWIMTMLNKQQKYSERIPLKRDRSFDIPQNVSDFSLAVPQLVRSAYRMNHSQKGLYDLTKEISQKHQELRFSFKLDPENKWIEYSVQKQNLNVGDEVFWENQGVSQWEKSKKITSIQKDPNSGKKYAFVDNNNVGISLEELILFERIDFSNFTQFTSDNLKNKGYEAVIAEYKVEFGRLIDTDSHLESFRSHITTYTDLAIKVARQIKDDFQQRNIPVTPERIKEIHSDLLKKGFDRAENFPLKGEDDETKNAREKLISALSVICDIEEMNTHYSKKDKI